MAELDFSAWPFAMLLAKLPSWRPWLSVRGLCLVLLALQFGLQPLLARRLLPRGSFASVILLSSNAMKVLISASMLLRLKLLSIIRDRGHMWNFKLIFIHGTVI